VIGSLYLLFIVVTFAGIFVNVTVAVLTFTFE